MRRRGAAQSGPGVRLANSYEDSGAVTRTTTALSHPTGSYFTTSYQSPSLFGFSFRRRIPTRRCATSLQSYDVGFDGTAAYLRDHGIRESTAGPCRQGCEPGARAGDRVSHPAPPTRISRLLLRDISGLSILDLVEALAGRRYVQWHPVLCGLRTASPRGEWGLWIPAGFLLMRKLRRNNGAQEANRFRGSQDQTFASTSRSMTPDSRLRCKG